MSLNYVFQILVLDLKIIPNLMERRLNVHLKVFNIVKLLYLSYQAIIDFI